MMQKKLSPAMTSVIALMQEGWELGASRGLRSSFWLQKDGLGRGGETKYISSATFAALYDRSLIEENAAGRKHWHTTPYRLTEAGRKILTS